MSTQVNVLFFASLREDVGCSNLMVNAATISDLLAGLESELPRHAMQALRQDNVRIAVNQQLIEGEIELSPGDEVAFLPPVTGG